jgi:uncharacterized membrane protein YcaP (DUF421 family)
MAQLFSIDWQTLLTPDVSIAESFVRGSFVYLLLFGLLRFLPNRHIGAVGLTDLLVVVLVANAVQNALADDYRSLIGGLVLVSTIFFWSYVLNWLAYRFPKIQQLLRSRTLPLIQDGRLQWNNMREEMITEEELRSTLRLQGVDNVSLVKKAQMEADGRISVVTYDQHTHSAPGQQIANK